MIVGGFNDLGKVEIIDPLDNSANFPIMTINYPKSHEFEVFSIFLQLQSKQDAKLGIGSGITQSIDETFECCVSKFNLCDWRVE